MCCQDATASVKFNYVRPIITNDDWVFKFNNSKKGSFIMRLFGKSKLIKELEQKIDNLEWKIESNKNTFESLSHQLKVIKLTCNIFPYEQLHPEYTDYKKDRTDLESKGYTLQGCVNKFEIWVNKGVKNG